MATITPQAYGSHPTEIDCLLVEKVFASCAQTVTTTQIVTPWMIPEDGACIPPGMTSGSLPCSVDLSASSCVVGATTPSGNDSINNITFTISAVVDVTCPSGTIVPITLYTTTTAPLYNPAGTNPQCTILSGTCSAVVLPNGQLSINVTLCLLLQTVATVQLLIPTYGYCVPTPCEVAATGICPPSPLFPPQS